MSAFQQFQLFPDMQETFRKEITEGEAALFASVVGNYQQQGASSPFDTGEVLSQPADHSLLLIGMIGGLLHNHIPGNGSKCITMQFEFLAPVFSGDRIETVIRLTDLDPAKHLATFQTDCYNQEKKQVITGQAVMFVPFYTL
jgi:acyl dehydratase